MGDMSRRVSIITAAYNAEKTVGMAIESVLAQTYTDWELLVINDCSEDNTAQIVRGYMEKDDRIKLLENDTNSGVSLSRKRGMEAAQGGWIAVLDSDDLWTPDKLEKQMKLADSTGAKLIFTGSAFIDDDGNKFDWKMHVPAVLTHRQLLKQNLVSNSSVLVKTELYRQHYAVGDKMHEDFAVWLGITKEGYDAYGIDEPLLIYRLGKSSKSSNKIKAAKMNWNTYRYVGLNFVSASYYMCWYVVKSLLKYSHFK